MFVKILYILAHVSHEGEQTARVLLEVPPLHDGQWTRGHRCVVGRKAVPEVGALDQGVSLVGDQSPERDGGEVTSLLPHGVSSSEVVARFLTMSPGTS